MSPRSDLIKLCAKLPENCAGQRLDQVLARQFTDYSRCNFQRWLEEGAVRLNGTTVSLPRTKVKGGESIEIMAKLTPRDRWDPQNLPLDVLYADPSLLVINKPAGLVVHPGAGNPQGTMVNALLHYAPELALLPRAGLIHRLDKDTTGLLVVARDIVAHGSLTAQLSRREVQREYEAIVNGQVLAGGTINAPLGRHPVDRKRIAVVPGGRSALTHYRVLRRFAAHTHLRIRLETGRTHQIRVHMSHISHSLVGDQVYGSNKLKSRPEAKLELTEALRVFKRQALHAVRLGLKHPNTGEQLSWEAPLPEDMRSLLAILE